MLQACRGVAAFSGALTTALNQKVHFNQPCAAVGTKARTCRKRKRKPAEKASKKTTTAKRRTPAKRIRKGVKKPIKRRPAGRVIKKKTTGKRKTIKRRK